MTVETETAILKALEKLEQKLDRFIETTQKELTDIKVGQAELKGEFKVIQLINGALFISFIGAIVKLVFFPNA